jgi:hypothetical protein
VISAGVQGRISAATAAEQHGVTERQVMEDVPRFVAAGIERLRLDR